MADKSKKSHTEDHNQLPSDEGTRKKIDKHLSDIDDTISEEDIKNINTDTGVKTADTESNKKKEQKKEDRKDEEDTDPEKEAPTPWEILD